VGVTPTYGRVSGYGAFRGSETIDAIGPLARTVRDAAIMLQSIAGYDPRDPTSVDQPVPDYLDTIERGPAGLRIGVPSSFFWDGVDPDIEALVRKAIEELESAGAELHDVELTAAAEYYTALRVVLAVENRVTHSVTFPSRRADYGKAAAALLDAVQGTPEELETAMSDSMAVLSRARGGEADAFLEGIDVLAVPTTRHGPLSIAEARGLYDRADITEIETRADPKNTAVLNATGQPSISVPCGSMSEGIPVGLMFVARQWDEPSMLRAARAYEMVRGPFPAPPV
jgi:Asp-tRNA(Asn)/Glu-tRNA(Gln) amidotransferase A subunit family amidase